MPLWYYDKKGLKSTPSIQDGVDHETEQRYPKAEHKLRYHQLIIDH